MQMQQQLQHLTPHQMQQLQQMSHPQQVQVFQQAPQRVVLEQVLPEQGLSINRQPGPKPIPH